MSPFAVSLGLQGFLGCREDCKDPQRWGPETFPEWGVPSSDSRQGLPPPGLTGKLRGQLSYGPERAAALGCAPTCVVFAVSSICAVYELGEKDENFHVTMVGMEAQKGSLPVTEQEEFETQTWPTRVRTLSHSVPLYLLLAPESMEGWPEQSWASRTWGPGWPERHPPRGPRKPGLC